MARNNCPRCKKAVVPNAQGTVSVDRNGRWLHTACAFRIGHTHRVQVETPAPSSRYADG